jgi:hypothetical protein
MGSICFRSRSTLIGDRICLCKKQRRLRLGVLLLVVHTLKYITKICLKGMKWKTKIRQCDWFLNFSDSVMGFWTVPTVWLVFELFRQCDGFWNCSDNVMGFWTVPTVWWVLELFRQCVLLTLIILLEILNTSVGIHSRDKQILKNKQYQTFPKSNRKIVGTTDIISYIYNVKVLVSKTYRHYFDIFNI